MNVCERRIDHQIGYRCAIFLDNLSFTISLASSSVNFLYMHIKYHLEMVIDRI